MVRKRRENGLTPRQKRDEKSSSARVQPFSTSLPLSLPLPLSFPTHSLMCVLLSLFRARVSKVTRGGRSVGLRSVSSRNGIDTTAPSSKAASVHVRERERETGRASSA